MHQEVKYGRRQDWHQTSTGVGHHFRPGYYFPDSEFKVCDIITYFIHEIHKNLVLDNGKHTLINIHYLEYI